MNMIERIIEYLWPHGDKPTDSQIYAILDGARDRRIEPMVRLSGLEYCCLYSGRLSPRLQAAAPYIVHLSPGSRFTRELLELGWGQSWGFFTIVPPDVTLQAHRRHFRTLLRVQDEKGRILVFRFYDPRVLRVYLAHCANAEAHQIFGPAPRILVEGAEPTTLMAYAYFNSIGVISKRISLQDYSGDHLPRYGNFSLQANFQRKHSRASITENADRIVLHQRQSYLQDR